MPLTRNSYKKYPDQVFLKLTNRCNLACEICGQARNRKNNPIAFANEDLNFNRTKVFLEQIPTLYSYVFLWGGEPLLHPDLLKFIDYFSSTSKHTEINTNGMLLYEKAPYLVKHKVNRIIISLDGPAEVHDAIRNKPGCYEKVIAGVDRLASLKTRRHKEPLIQINCVISEMNQSCLLSFIKTINKLPVSTIVLQFPCFVTASFCCRYEEMLKRYYGMREASTARGFLRNYPVDINLIAKQIKQITALYGNKVLIYQRFLRTEGDFKTYFHLYRKLFGQRICHFIFNGLSIEPNGNIVGCPDFHDIILGNIRQGFNRIWNNKKYVLFRRLFCKHGNFPICNRCCHFL